MLPQTNLKKLFFTVLNGVEKQDETEHKRKYQATTAEFVNREWWCWRTSASWNSLQCQQLSRINPSIL